MVPLVTIPYIVRVIGAEKFGVISLAFAVSYYFRIIVEYGFSITGVQLIAQTKDDIQKRSEVYSTIITIQLILTVVGLLVMLILINVWPTLRAEQMVYMVTYIIVPANVFMALWFFIGMEEMHYLNIINLIGRISYIVLIFIFLRQREDYYIIPILNGGSLLLAGLASLVFMYRKFNIRYQLPNFAKMKLYLREGWPLFISNFGINLYRNSNVIILGAVSNMEIVGIYSAGEKIVKVIQSVFAPITQTLFPYVSRLRVSDPRKSFRSIKILLKYMVLLSGSVTLLILVLANPLTKLALGPELIAAKIVIQIGAFVILFGVINYILGIIFMTNFGLKNEFSKSVVITGIMNLIICYLLARKWNLVGAAIAFTGAEVLLFGLLVGFIFLKRKNWLTEINGT
ncbi:flippase [bacterium]|nr:flippase [bacterium]